jgi:hypothetical protein
MEYRQHEPFVLLVDSLYSGAALVAGRYEPTIAEWASLTQPDHIEIKNKAQREMERGKLLIFLCLND